MKKTKIAIIDDHKLVREGIKAMFIGNSDIEIVLDTDNGEELISAIEGGLVDVIFLDIAMPGKSGIELLSEITRYSDHTKVIMLSAKSEPQSIESAMMGGASGFISKETNKDELLRAIKAVAAGKRFFGEDLIDTVYEGYANRLNNTPSVQEPTLSVRERQIIRLISEGYLQKQIAHQMEISIKTVESHKSNIMNKLGIDNTAALIKYAIKNGIAEL